MTAQRSELTFDLSAPSARKKRSGAPLRPLAGDADPEFFSRPAASASLFSTSALANSSNPFEYFMPHSPLNNVPLGRLTLYGQIYDNCVSAHFSDGGVIGMGNYGTVNRMRHLASGTDMAVKRIRYTMDPVDQKRLMIDLDIVMKSSKCPYIVTFYGCLFSEGDVWICMEVMSSSVDKILAHVHRDLQSNIPEDILGMIALSVVHALDYLKSELNIIHRDVKPSNILVNFRGSIKLCDFGISGYLVDSIALTRDVGCRPYMAPERIDPLTPQDSEPGGYDIRSDVWSLGIMLIELATGAFPYPPWTSIFDQLEQVVRGAAPQLSRDGRFSLDCLDFTSQCLIKDYLLRPKYKQLLAHPWLCRYEIERADTAGWYSQVAEALQRIGIAL